MRSKIFLCCVLMILIFNPVSAQQPPGDPFGESFFAPELLIQHQLAIGLSDDQRNLIKTEIRKAQTQSTELQWQLQDEMEKVISLVKLDRVDEQQALAQLEKILNIEREIKRIQLTLVIRLKNNLTAEQQARLREIRNKAK
jgi:Spy/CpxP family protein refolding chaperone